MKTRMIKLYLIITFLTTYSIFKMNAQGVGIGGVPSTYSKLHVKDGGVLFEGYATPPSTYIGPPMEGAGSRLMWYPTLSAFRVGSVSGTQWDFSSLGNNSFAAGQNTTAIGENSTALGFGTSSVGPKSVSMGDKTKASGNSAVAMGLFTEATSNYSLAIGTHNDLTATSSPKLFEVGNGASIFSRNNAFTVFANGQVGIGTVLPRSTFETNGSFGAKITTITTTGAVVLDESASIWYFTATPSLITLPAANLVPNRMFILTNTQPNKLLLDVKYKAIDGSEPDYIPEISSITLISDGNFWLQIR
jgi:hypothetical protein